MAKSLFTNDKVFQKSQKVIESGPEGSSRDASGITEESQSSFQEFKNQNIAQLTSQIPEPTAGKPDLAAELPTVPSPEKIMNGATEGFSEAHEAASKVPEGDVTLPEIKEVKNVKKNIPPGGIGSPEKNLQQKVGELKGNLEAVSSKPQELSNNLIDKVENTAGDFGTQVNSVTGDAINNLDRTVNERTGLITKLGELCKHADTDSLFDLEFGKFLLDIPEIQSLISQALNLNQSELLRALLDCFKLKKSAAFDLGGDLDLNILPQLNQEAEKGNPETTGILTAFAETNGDPIDRTALAEKLTKNITDDEETKTKTKEVLGNKPVNPPSNYTLEFSSGSLTAYVYPYHNTTVTVTSIEFPVSVNYIRTTDTAAFDDLNPGDIVKNGDPGIPHYATVRGKRTVGGDHYIDLDKETSWKQEDGTAQATFLRPEPDSGNLSKIHEGQYVLSGPGIPSEGKKIVSVGSFGEIPEIYFEINIVGGSSVGKYEIGMQPSLPLNTDMSNVVESKIPGTDTSVMDINKVGEIHTSSDILSDGDIYGKSDDAKIAQTLMFA